MLTNPPAKKYRCLPAVLLLAALAGYAWLSGSFLCQFPYVHSDEAWLSGLTRAIWEQGSFGATEPFFNLKPRWPHGIKLLFHSLQGLALRLGGYRIAAFRLLSLAAALPCLALFYLAARRLFPERREPALLATLLLGLDVQFIYASHLARQEIFILLALCACLLLLLKAGVLANREILGLGLITGLAAGFHPNAFLIACMCGAALLARLAFGQARARQLLLYIVAAGAAAGVFVLISLGLDQQFFSHYAAYAQSEFGLNLSLAERLGEAPDFWRKLFAGVSGTYYLPELRPQLFLFPTMSLLLGCYVLAMRREQREEAARAGLLLSAALGLTAGIMLIGRYNQLSLVFLFPLGWLITMAALNLFGKGLCRALSGLALAIVIACSWTSISPWLATDYQDYLAEFQAHIPAGAKTLANLNSEYAFAEGQLLDYRNLAYLAENGLDIAGYVAKYEIAYIAYSDELDYIDQHRPYWNVIYGDIDIQGLKAYLAQHCRLVHAFKSPVYGVRITGLVGAGDYGWVGIYQVVK